MKGNCPDPTLSGSVENFAISDVLESDIFPDLASNTFKSQKDISIGKYDNSLSLVEITKAKGSAWRSIGGNIGDKLYLFSEEALFLFECNKLVIHGELGPLSSEIVWSLLCPSKHAFHQYLVYAQLKRMGFIVIRHGAYVTKYRNIYHEHISEKKFEEHDECIQPSKRSKLDFDSEKDCKYHFPCPSFDVYEPGDYYMKSALLQPNYSVSVVASSQPFPTKETMRKLEQHPNLLLALVTECNANFYSFKSGIESI